MRGDAVNPTRVMWPHLLMPYVKNNQLFLCASTAQGIWTTTNQVTPASQIRCSYGYNLCALGAGGYGAADTAVAMASIRAPAETAAIVDIMGCACGVKGTNLANTTCFAPLNIRVTGAPPPAPGLHNDGLNVVYADGHAKWQQTNALMPGQRLWSN